ncbi:MAG: hypothetical protein ACI39C_07490 [Dietzia sp.]
MTTQFTMPAVLKVNLKDQWDLRTTQRGILEVDQGEIQMEALAFKGDKGDKGEPGQTLLVQEPVPEHSIPTLGDMTEEQIGWAWPIVGKSEAIVYNGVDLVRVPLFDGRQGEPGVSPQIAPETAVVSGTETSLRLVEIAPSVWQLQGTVARGAKGDPGVRGVPGPSAAIQGAEDVQGPFVEGQTVVMGPGGKFVAADLAQPSGVYKKSGADSDWSDVDTGSNWTGDTIQLTMLQVPAQDFAWEPEVHGHVEMQYVGIAVRFDAEVRLGSASGPLVALGPGMASTALLSTWTSRSIQPAAEETTGPADSRTIVPAGQVANLYLVLRRVESAAALRVLARKQRAHLRVRLLPVMS